MIPTHQTFYYLLRDHVEESSPSLLAAFVKLHYTIRKEKLKIKRILKEAASFGSQTTPTKMGNLSLFLHL